MATAHEVLHGDEEVVHGDAGYQGVGKREENRDADVDWRTAMKAGRAQAAGQGRPGGGGGEAQGVGSGEGGASFLYVKQHFGYRKVRYRGLAKKRSGSRFAWASRTC